MDIKRSNRIKKAAAIAALVLVVGGASVAAEVGNGGLFGGDIVNATVNANGEHEIYSTQDYYDFMDAKVTGTKLVGKLMNDIEVTKYYDTLDPKKELYGNGKTITLDIKVTHNDIRISRDKKTISYSDASWHTVSNHTTDGGREISADDGGVLLYKNREYGYYDYSFEDKTETTENNKVVKYSKEWGYEYKDSYEEKASLFGQISKGAKVENLNIKVKDNGTISGKENYVGALCKENYGSIRYVTVDAKVESSNVYTMIESHNKDWWGNDRVEYSNEKEYVSTDATGIICGVNRESGVIFGCTVSGSINATGNYIGSICGRNEGSIKRCSSSAKIDFNSSKSMAVGGLCGYNEKDLYDCLFEGGLKDNYWKYNLDYILYHSERLVGGVCGYLDEDATVRNSLYYDDETNYIYNGDDYDCVGSRVTKDNNLANLFRYTKTGENSASEHYHYNNFPNFGDENNEINPEDYSITSDGKDGKVCDRLNKGYDDSRDERVWKNVAGKNHPVLCLEPNIIQYNKPTPNNHEYNGKEEALVTYTDANILKGSGKFFFSLTDDGNGYEHHPELWKSTNDKGEIVPPKGWSADIPTQKYANVGDDVYTVYFTIVPVNSEDDKMEYTFDAYDGNSVDVKISPKELVLKTKKEEYPYTNSAVNLDEELVIADKLFGNDTCEIKNPKLKLNGSDVTEAKEIGTYEVSATASNTNYTLGSTFLKVGKGVASVTKPTADSYYYGKPLSEAHLTEGWSWVDHNDDEVLDANDYEYKVVKQISDFDAAHFDYSNLGTEYTYDVVEHTLTTTVKFTVKKTAVNATVLPIDRTYDGTEQALVTVNADKEAEVKFTSVTKNGETIDLNIKDNVPVATDAGEYVVNYTVTTDKNHRVEKEDDSVTVTITKAELDAINDALTAELDYGEATVETARAAFETELKNKLGDDYAKYQFELFGIKDKNVTDILDADTYRAVVKYYLATDTTKTNSEGTITEILKVNKVEAKVELNEATGLVYDGDPKELVTVKNSEGVSKVEFTVKDSAENVVDENGDGIATATEVGTYTVSCTVTPDNNHTAPVVTDKTVTITKAELDAIKETLTAELDYGKATVNAARAEFESQLKSKLGNNYDKYTFEEFSISGTENDAVLDFKENGYVAAVKYYLKKDNNPGVNSEGTITEILKVNKVEAKVELNEATGLVYDGDPKELVTVKNSEGVSKVEFTVKDSAENVVDENGDGIATATEVGTYTVSCTVTPDNNHTAPVVTDKTVTITKAELDAIKETLTAELDYGKATVNAARAEFESQLKSKLGNNYDKYTFEEFSISGTENDAVLDFKENGYVAAVKYYLKKDNNPGVNSEGTITEILKVNKVEAKVELNEATGLVYDGDPKELVTVKNSEGVSKVEFTVKDSAENVVDENGDGIATATEVGTYTVSCTVTPDNNHTAPVVTDKTVTITKAELDAIKETLTAELDYGEATVETARAAFETELKNKLGDDYAKYQFELFGIKDKNVTDVLDADTYRAVVKYYLATDTTKTNSEGTITEILKVNKVEAKVEFNEATGLVYDGDPKRLVTVKNSEGVSKVEFTVKDSAGNVVADQAAAATAVNAGTYKVTCHAEPDANHTAPADQYFDVTIIAQKVSASVEAKNSTYDGDVHQLITETKGEGLTITYTDVTKKDDKDFKPSYDTNGIPVATDAGEYTITYTVKADDNHTLTSSATGSVDVKIAPRAITVDWTGSKNEFAYDDNFMIEAGVDIKATFVGIVDGDKTKNSVKPIYHGLDGKDAKKDYKAYVTIADGNYTITGKNEFFYSIVAKATTASVTATPFEYDGKAHNLVTENLGEGASVEYISVNGTAIPSENNKVIPTAVNAGTYVVEYKIVTDNNHSYTQTSNKVTVEVGKAELTVTWTEGEEFTFDPALKEGEYQVPSIESVTGYKTDADKTDYKLTVIPAEGNDGRSASDHQKAVVVFERSRTAESDNYYFEIEEKEYKIAKNTFENLADKIEGITAEVVYGESSSTIEAAKTALEAKLVENLGENYEDKYKFAPESFEFKDINDDLLDDSKVLNVAEYTGEIKYTLNSDGQADTNYEGTFKWTLNVKEAAATIDITPYSGEYDAESHPVAEVKSENCKVRYSITVDGVDHISYSVPTVADAGEYVIGYTVEVDGNHKLPADEKGNVIASGTITAEIAQKEVSFRWNDKDEWTEAPEFNYNDDVVIKAEPVGICGKDEGKVDVAVTIPAKKGASVGKYTATAVLKDGVLSSEDRSVLCNYKVTDRGFDYKIIKATPSVNIKVDDYTATYGDKLSDIADQLPKDDNGTYTWKNENAPVGDAGENTHTVVYKPNDDKNNNIVETEVTVDVLPKEVHLIWNIENGAEFTYDGSSQDVSSYPDLNDVFDRDEKAFEVTVTADDFVNAGSHKANAAINDTNYVIAAGDESRTFGILRSGELKPMNYSETYEYGTTAKEIFDDLFEKHFGDFTKLAEDYSIDPNTVVVYKNGSKIDTEKLQNYAKSCFKARNLIYDKDVVDQINKLGRSFYNKPDFNVANNINDYLQIKQLVDTNRESIKKFISAGALPGKEKYNKLITLFEKYEAVREAEDVMQGVGEYKITVNYNYMANKNEQSLERFLKLSGNYHPAALTAEVKITPCVIENIFADIDSRPYNGGKDVSVNNYTLISKKDGKNKEWNLGGYLTNGAEFVSADAGTDKINAELTLTNENFCFGFDEAGKPVMTKKFHEADTDGCITKAEFPYTVNLEGFAGERLSTVTVPGVIHGEFRWNDTNTVIAEGSNVIDASEYTFTPDAKDPFNRNYDVVLTVNVNGVKKPVETVVETAVETVIVTEETKPSVTEVSGKPVTTAETSAKVSEAQTTPAGTETTAESGAVTTTVTETTTADVTKAETTDLPEITLPASTTAKFMGEVTEAPAIVTKPSATTAVTTAATTAKTEVTTVASTTAETKAVTTAKVTEAEAAGVTTAETKPVTTAKVTEATTGVTTAETKAATTATVTEAEAAGVTTAETKAVTTAKVTEATIAGVTTAETKPVTTAKVTEAETAGVTTAETKPVTTANVTEAITAGVTTAETKAVTTAKVTEAETAGVTTAETKAVTTAKVTEAEAAGVTTAETKAVTTAKVTEAEAAGVTTAETKPVTTAKVTEAEAAGVTTAETKAVTTANVTEATTAGVTTAETKPVTTANVTEATTGVTTAETKPVTTAGVTTTVTEAGVTTTATETETAEVTTSATTAEITETPVTDITTDSVVTTASTTPGLIDIDLPEITTGVMGDVTENPAVVTEAVTTAQTEAVTTEAAKTGLDNIIDIIINNPDKVKQEVHEDGKISINGEQIRLALEDKMFFQGTESFDYPVRLKDFNAEKAYFDYAGFGFELPEGYTVDPESLSTDLKGNIKYYAPDSHEALALSAKTGYAAKGGYVVFRGVETRNLAPDAVLFTVKIKVSDTLDTCISKIGVSALYGRLTENSKLNADGTVEPHVAFIDNNAGDQLYTKETSTVSMGVKGDVNLDGKVTQVDATVILREILSLEVFKKSLLADNINLHDGTPEEGVALSHFLGNVNQSPNGLFTQIDATSILRGILERDMNGDKIVTEQIWKKVTNK